MIKLYGMHICPDCEQAREQLLFAGVDFEFLDFADSTANLKEFLKIPDGYYLPALVILGYPAKDALLPSQVQATVENRVRWNKW